MKVLLCEKTSMAREPVKETNLPGEFNEYYFGTDSINENLLLKNLPNDFLPLDPEEIALMVEDKINESAGRVLSNVGQRNLKLFKDYDKYSCKYSILLCRYE